MTNTQEVCILYLGGHPKSDGKKSNIAETTVHTLSTEQIILQEFSDHQSCIWPLQKTVEFEVFGIWVEELLTTSSMAELCVQLYNVECRFIRFNL